MSNKKENVTGLKVTHVRPSTHRLLVKWKIASKNTMSHAQIMEDAMIAYDVEKLTGLT